MPIRLFPTAALASVLLAGCNAGSTPPTQTAALVRPAAVSDAPLPAGSGCGPSIARQQAIVDADIATGNVGDGVGKSFSADLHQAAQACGAGRTGEAMGLLASARARYGYR